MLGVYGAVSAQVVRPADEPVRLAVRIAARGHRALVRAGRRGSGEPAPVPGLHRDDLEPRLGPRPGDHELVLIALVGPAVLAALRRAARRARFGEPAELLGLLEARRRAWKDSPPCSDKRSPASEVQRPSARTARRSSPAALSSAPGPPGIDPATGCAPDGIEAQTEQALRNLAASWRRPARPWPTSSRPRSSTQTSTTSRLLNEVYARHMPDPPPARSAPANVVLPRGLLVSIEAIAALPKSVANGNRAAGVTYPRPSNERLVLDHPARAAETTSRASACTCARCSGPLNDSA